MRVPWAMEHRQGRTSVWRRGVSALLTSSVLVRVPLLGVRSFAPAGGAGSHRLRSTRGRTANLKTFGFKVNAV